MTRGESRSGRKGRQSPYFSHIAEWIVAHPWRVILVWVLLLSISIPLAGILQSRLSASSSVTGTESARVERLISEQFGVDLNSGAVLIISGLRPIHENADKDLLETTVEALRELPQIATANSILNWPNGLMVGADGTGALIVVEVGVGAEARELEASLRDLAVQIDQASSNRDREVRLHWTGPFFLQADAIASGETGSRQGELLALPPTLLVLIFIFGSFRAALCPIVSAVFAIVVTIGCAGLIAIATSWFPSFLIQSVSSLIGLGLTIDYSLLTVNRFRKAYETGLAPRDAAVNGTVQSARTIAVAATSVMVGFGALLLVPIAEIRSVGVGGMLASMFSFLVTMTLLPALLALLAPRLVKSRVPAGGARIERLWATAASTICARPWTFLVISIVPLVLLSLPVQSLKIGLPGEDWLPREMASARGLDALEDIGRGGLANEILVVAEMPNSDTFLSAGGWAWAHEIYGSLALMEGVDTVLALPRTISAKLSPETLQGLRRKTLDPFLSADNRAMLFRVFPGNDVDYRGREELVRQIRTLDNDISVDAMAPTISVGGLLALTVDFVETVRRWMPFVIGLVILGAFLVLAISFRAPFIALKAVLLNLLSIAAAFGLATLVFIDGYAASFIGTTGPMEGILSVVPLIVFCAAFGVSMDYEVFLISRIASVRRKGTDETTAIVEGLAETGMVITSAAAVMIIVFSAFAATNFLPVKILGFTLAAAVFFDAAVVRVLTSPALMSLAGRWNWWPGLKG
jgi:RND superfamily putative drug exporter